MNCKHCGVDLMSSPEYGGVELFIRYLDCGVKHLVEIGLQVIGWRK